MKQIVKQKPDFSLQQTVEANDVFKKFIAFHPLLKILQKAYSS